jgi:hypothetical protein
MFLYCAQINGGTDSMLNTVGAQASNRKQAAAAELNVTNAALNGTVAPLNVATAPPSNNTTAPLNGTEAQPLNSTTAPVNGTKAQPSNSTTAPVNATVAPAALTNSATAPLNSAAAPSSNSTTAPVNGTEAQPALNGNKTILIQKKASVSAAKTRKDEESRSSSTAQANGRKTARNVNHKVSALFGKSQHKDIITYSFFISTSFTSMQGKRSSVAASPKKDAPCQHNQKELYVLNDDKAHFTEKRLELTPQWPSACAKEGCNNAFGSNYKVGTKNPVFCCVNANKKHHPCMHAYCKHCFEAWQVESTGQTPRKRRKIKKLEEYSV